MMYCGIDLHSNNSVVAIIDDADRVVAQKRLPNDIAKIGGFWRDGKTSWSVSWSSRPTTGIG